jgi:hypothetical protein
MSRRSSRRSGRRPVSVRDSHIAPATGALGPYRADSSGPFCIGRPLSAREQDRVIPTSRRSIASFCARRRSRAVRARIEAFVTQAEGHIMLNVRVEVHTPRRTWRCGGQVDDLAAVLTVGVRVVNWFGLHPRTAR